MPFYLPGDSTDACKGVDSYNAPRPAISLSYSNTLIGLCITFCIMILSSIPIIYRFRNEPMFFRIRPYPVLILMNVVLCVCQVGYLIPHALDTFPCWLEVAIHSVGTSLVAGVCTLRSLLFVVETQTSLVLQDQAPVIDDRDGMSTTTGGDDAGTQSGEQGFQSLFDALASATRLGYGLTSVDKLDIYSLSAIRRNQLSIFMVVVIPPILFLVIFVAALEVFRGGCVECPMFAESVAIILAPTVAVFSFPVFRLTWTAFRMNAADEQLVVREVLLSFLLAQPFLVGGYILELADPSGLLYYRVFSWRILTSLGPMMFWCLYFGMPFVYTVRYRSKRKQVRRKTMAQTSPVSSSSRDGRSRASSKDADFLAQCQTNPRLKKEFYAFAAQRYVMESLNFLQDVRAYNAALDYQSEKWKRKKAKQLMQVYISEGASQEVNISGRQRTTIMAIRVNAAPVEVLDNMFNEAYKSVLVMTASGIWLDFMSQRARESCEDAVVSSDL